MDTEFLYKVVKTAKLDAECMFTSILVLTTIEIVDDRLQNKRADSTDRFSFHEQIKRKKNKIASLHGIYTIKQLLYFVE